MAANVAARAAHGRRQRRHVSENEGLGWDDDPAKFKGHPRTSGSHTTVLRLARENNVPLMHTLAQLSYWSAYHLGKTGLKSMQVRGRMQQGMVADIVVFNPETVAEGSSYKAGENGLPPVGLPHVIVNARERPFFEKVEVVVGDSLFEV